MRHTPLLRFVLGVLAAGLLAAAASAQTPAPASVFVVHGIPGRDVAASLDPLLPVDVQVQTGTTKLCLLQGLTFGQIKGPFQIPAGSYTISISLANTVAPCSNAAVISPTVKVTSGETAAVVAALSPSGAPTAYPFAINVNSVVPKTDARIMVAHAADAPAVDVKLFRSGSTVAVLRNLTPGNEKSGVVPAKTYAANVLVAGTSTVALGPVELAPAKRSVTLVFAVGSAASGSLTLLTQTIPDVF